MEKTHDLKFAAGDRLRVRRQRWSVVSAIVHETCVLLTLNGAGVVNAGTTRCFLAPFDDIERDAAEGIRRISFGSWRRLCRAAGSRHGLPEALSAAAGADIDLLPHQLEPVLALMRGAATRLLLADEVGLGKTMQAGLALLALRESGAVERTLIVTPSGLRDQWAEQLAARFGLDAAVVDAPALRRICSDLPLGTNPWGTLPIAVASMDYLKRAEVLPAVLAAPWDVVVVDEAHMVSGESDRRRAMSALCGRTPYVLLLTATPHSGDADAFRALCGLGAVDDRPIVVFRRSRHDVGMSRKRRVGCLMVRPTAAERRMHALLARLSRLTRRHAASPDSALVLGVLHKRACSSPYALAQSVRRRLAALDGDAVPAPQQLALPLLDELGELDEADEPPAMDVALLNDAAEERRMLTALFEAAQAAAGAESKIARLRRLLSRLHSRNEAAIVFTEYRDTLRHVAARLDCRCQLLHGGLRRDERRMVLDNFVSGRCQTLLATDAAGEGLNLQQTCRVVINLELPWNPSRLEQRIGRVDRIGQARQVHAVHLIARDTGEARVLARLRARAAQARADIGAPDVLGDAPRGARDDVPAWLELRGSMSPPAGRPSGYVIGGESRDAADLHRRLACLRASDRARDQADERFAGRTDPDTKVAYSRKRAARALLGDGVLIVVRSVYEDGCGRIVATHLTPLRLRQPRPGTRISEEALVQAAEDWLTPELLRRLDPSIVEWESRTAAAHRAFWGARVERQRAIDQLPGSGSSLLFQPGLFDRRADRQHAASGADEREGRDAARLRELAARAALSANFRPPRPAFVLTRRRR